MLGQVRLVYVDSRGLIKSSKEYSSRSSGASSALYVQKPNYVPTFCFHLSQVIILIIIVTDQNLHKSAKDSNPNGVHEKIDENPLDQLVKNLGEWKGIVYHCSQQSF